MQLESSFRLRIMTLLFIAAVAASPAASGPWDSRSQHAEPVKIVDQPIEVLDVSPTSPAREPLQFFGFDGFNGIFGVVVIDFGPVPDRERWVIEYVSGRVGVDPGTVARCSIQSVIGTDVQAEHQLPISFETQQTNVSIVTANPTLLYIESGQTLRFTCTITQPNGVGSREMRAAMSGYKVSTESDAP